MAKRSYIVFEQQLCIACGACCIACMDENDLTPQSSLQMYRKISIIENGHGKDAKFYYLSLSCNHCENAPCIAICPNNCIYKDGETGFTVYNNERCIGCRSCYGACPYDAPVFASDGKMEKCNGCNDRVKAGLEPACVRVCPFDTLALTVIE